MKKVSVCILIVVMLAAAFCGCGNNRVVPTPGVSPDLRPTDQVSPPMVDDRDNDLDVPLVPDEVVPDVEDGIVDDNNGNKDADVNNTDRVDTPVSP